MKYLLAQLDGQWILFFSAMLGGVVDYANKVMRGEKRLHLGAFVVHILSAVFFGWVVGTVVSGFDYAPDLVHAAGGVGGFLGVRVADLADVWLQRRKKD
jgi:hypothetical protein